MDASIEQQLEKERNDFFESTKNEVQAQVAPIICEHRTEIMGLLKFVVDKIPNPILRWAGGEVLKYVDTAIKRRCGQS